MNATVTIPKDTQAIRTDFEQASSVEIHTLVAGTYPVEFTDIRGNEVDEADAYYAQIRVPAVHVTFSYKYGTAKSQPDTTRTLRLYGYEYRAGKGFCVLGIGGTWPTFHTD